LRRPVLGEEEELKNAVERRKAQNAARVQEASDPIQVAIAEWEKRVAPAIGAAVRDANTTSAEAGITFAIRRQRAQRITPEATVEIPAIAIEKSSGRAGFASQLAGGPSVVDDRPLAEPYLDIRLDRHGSVVVTALGCSITRSGGFSLDEFSEKQIRDTVLEFAKTVVDLPEKP
jgi:hypothetical protein